MSDRRQSERSVRRVPVRFWLREEGAHPRKGYTTNLSDGGMFVATTSPYRSGKRLRLEVGEEAVAFAVEGRVAHSRLLALELHKLGISGMGVEFLTVGELVAELLGQALKGKEETAAFEEAALGDGLYRLRFTDVKELLRVYRKDVVHGGLFVPTRKPAALSARITLEVELPGPASEPLRLTAQVVQRIDPEGAASRPNLLAGMGVHFDDPAAARKAFERAVQALGASG
jgi:Tfp pilus assembly protein PilZ